MEWLLSNLDIVNQKLQEEGLVPYFFPKLHSNSDIQPELKTINGVKKTHPW